MPAVQTATAVRVEICQDTGTYSSNKTSSQANKKEYKKYQTESDLRFTLLSLSPPTADRPHASEKWQKASSGQMEDCCVPPQLILIFDNEKLADVLKNVI